MNVIDVEFRRRQVKAETVTFVFARRKDEVFLKLKELLEAFKIGKYYTDNWGSYSENLDEDKHEIGKKIHKQLREKILLSRTRVKRLRKTICFSKSIKMHDIVIGLLLNVLDFGLILELKIISTELVHYP